MKELDSFTVERLGEIKNAFLDCNKETAPNIGEIFALIDIALAAKRAEPVAYWHEGCDFDEGAFSYAKQGGCTRPLYTTPQLNSPEIPDERLIALANHIQSSLGGLPDEWQPWADEIVSDLRKYAAPEKENG